jgi:branched-chain amino acid transport system permease protein
LLSGLLPNFWLEVITNLGIFSLASLGLYVCFIAKQYSLAHAALMGTGAYAAGILSSQHPQVPLVVGLALAVVAGMGMGLVVGVLLALRLSEFYLAIGTLAFNLALNVVVINVDALGGVNGVSNVSLDTTPEMVLGILVVAIVLVLWLERTRLGRAMRAIHEDEQMAAVNGVRVWAVKLAAFSIGGGLAAIAGALQTHDLGIARPELYDYAHSVTLWVPLVVGGSASVAGPLLGTLVYVLLPTILNRTLQVNGYPQLDENWILGALLIVAALLRPNGLLGTRQTIAARNAVRALTRRFRGRPPVAAAAAAKEA